jgi:DNA-directed RNA polymerase specialized sigma24 family protein
MLTELEQHASVEQLTDRAMQLAGTVARDLGIADVEECESLALERLVVAVRQYQGPPELAEAWRWASHSIRNAIRNHRRDTRQTARAYCNERGSGGGMLTLPEDLEILMPHLPGGDAMVLRQRLQGWTPEEIAQRLGVAAKTVRNTIYASIRFLKKVRANSTAQVLGGGRETATHSPHKPTTRAPWPGIPPGQELLPTARQGAKGRQPWRCRKPKAANE